MINLEHSTFGILGFFYLPLKFKMDSKHEMLMLSLLSLCLFFADEHNYNVAPTQLAVDPFPGIAQVVPNQHVAVSPGLTPDGITQVVPTDYVLVVSPDQALSEVIQVAPTQQLVEFSPNQAHEDIIKDWNYIMRRDMQEIIPGLFLGPYAAAMKSKLQTLQEHQITHIVCIRQNIEAHHIRSNFPDIFHYLVLDIADLPTENIIKHIPQVRDFIDGCMKCAGKVLVHGNAGISRSAALVIAYVMEKYGLSYKTAFMYVQQKRFCINPNEGFTQQLIEYEPMYRARLSIEAEQISLESGNLKRKCHFENDGCLQKDPNMMT